MKACLEEAFVPHYSTLKQLKVTGMFLSWTSPLLPVERCECLIPAGRVNVTHFSPPFCDRKQIRMKRRLARFADDVPDPDDGVFPAQTRSYKRRRCENAGRCRRRAEPAATFTTRTEGSSERHRLRRGGGGGRGRAAEADVSSSRPGSRTNKHKSPGWQALVSLPKNHAAHLWIQPKSRMEDRDSKWHWCPAGRHGDGTGTDTKEGSWGCREDPRVFPGHTKQKKLGELSSQERPDGFVSATVPSLPLRFLSAPSFLTLPQPVNRHPVDLLKLGSPSCTSVPSWRSSPHVSELFHGFLR